MTRPADTPPAPDAAAVLAADEAARLADAAAAPDDTPAADDAAPVVSLGTRGGLLCYWSRSYRRYYELAPEKHTRLNLYALAPLSEWAAWVDPSLAARPDMQVKAARAIMEEAARRLIEAHGGRVFRADCMRARGIWRDPITGGVLYNAGNAVFLAPPDGAGVLPVDALRGGVLYDGGAALPHPAADALTDEEGRALIDFLTARTWTFKGAGVLLAGWIVNAILAGALPFRSHVWINAPRNTGKTFLRDDILRILGGFSVVSDGNQTSTAAGLRRDLNGAALPAIKDEQEPARRNSRGEDMLEKILEYARIATKGGKVTMAAGDDKTRDYTLQSCFMFLSVENTLSENETNSTRFLSLRLRTAGAGELERILSAQSGGRALIGRADFTPRLIARLMQQARAITENAAALEPFLRARGAEPRRAEMFAILAAGAHALTHAGALDAAAMENAAALLAAYTSADDRESELELCLNYFRARVLNYCGKNMSLVQWLDIAAHSASMEASVEAERAIGALGITIRNGSVFLNTSQTYTRAIWKNTPFETRAFSVLKAADYKMTSRKAAGKLTPRRVCVIPLADILPDSAADE